MRDDYINDVKGGRLKRFSAFLADRDWNAGGVSCFCLIVMCSCVCVCVSG